ncbi:sacsin N-terminal ATP-binding-like domain-containing protein [Labilibaculum antarcticum]|nr:DUF3883 domain-containing protein [Labilibaculum antarcticum]
MNLTDTLHDTTFIEGVKALIKENVATYKISTKRIISDYRGEKGFTEAYNGRQLLELLQNADDAKTDEVLISLNKEKQLLTISNNGNPFDLKGLQSLMLANTSSKNKKEFIGNKGLGFRSILNWATEVKIMTSEVCLTFSPQIAKQQFESIIEDEIQRQVLIDEEDDLQAGTVPFAVLAIPSFEPIYDSDLEWITSIQIEYKAAYIEDIEKQLATLKPEILLFLNSTKRIRIESDGHEKILSLSKTIIEDQQFINVNNEQWQVYDSKDLQINGQENKNYRIKIAWKEDLSDKDSRFFTYFPTQLSTHLPYLIHATFDLDPSRNYLNPTDDNKYILRELVSILACLSIDNLQNSAEPNWDSYRILLPLGKSDSKLLIPFFQDLQDKRNSLALYPCLDGNYRTMTSVKYYGNKFAIWVQKNSFQEFFPELLIPIDEDINFNTGHFPAKYSKDEFTEKMGQLTSQISEIEERVELIALLMDDSFSQFHNKISLPLLLNHDEKVVEASKQVFTLKEGSTDEYEIPEYVQLSFISNNLYLSLTNRFSADIAKYRSNNEDISRPLKKVLSPLFNMGSNDITDVIRNMTSATNRHLRTTTVDKKTILQQYSKSLFHIFKKNPERRGIIDEKVLLLNRNGEETLSSDLFLGKGFPSGNKTELIFEDFYENKDFVADMDSWDFYQEDMDSKFIENFFLWLGVNKHTKFKKIEKDVNRWNSDPYIDFVFKNTRTPENNPWKYYNVFTIDNLAEILESKDISTEKLVAWILIDKKILSQLERENQDVFKYTYNKNTTELHEKPSYIFHQLYRENLFANILIEDELIGNSGFDTFDFENRVFSELNIDRTDINYVLKKLGANKSFNDLQPHKIYELLRQVTNDDANGSQTVYNRVLEYFAKNKEAKLRGYKPDFSEIKYFARKGGLTGKLEPIMASEVYYSDNNILPQNILNKFWMLNLPKRKGEQNVKEFFGVSLIKDEVKNIKLVSYEGHPLNKTFISYFDRIKPFLLTYRLNTLKKGDNEQTEVNSIKNLSICLVDNCQYSFGEIKQIELDENEFINIDSTFYLKSSPNFRDINQLQKNSFLCDAIAEMICICFKIKELKNTFRTIFKDHIREVEHLIKVDELTDLRMRAFKLLGFSEVEMMFWEKVFVLKGKSLQSSISNTKILSSVLEKEFSLILPDYYQTVDFNDFKNLESFNFLVWISNALDFSLDEILESNSFGIRSSHKRGLENTLKDLKSRFNSLLWLKLNNEKEKQALLIDQQISFDQIKSDESILQILDDNKFNLDLNYIDIIKDATYRLFNLSLLVDVEIKKCFENKYKHLLDKYSLHDDDLQDNKLKSLLYFEGNEEKLEKEFISLSRCSVESDDLKKIEPRIGNVIISQTTAIEPKGTSKPTSNRWIHSDKDISRNKKLGEKAEELVFNTLVASVDVEEVEWVSGNSKYKTDKSDTFHYDIQYKNINNPDWFYLEVKAFNGRTFHLSKDEKKTGFDYKDRYQIALVHGNNIHIIENFFIDEDSFLNNEHYSVSSADYLISLKIKEN